MDPRLGLELIGLAIALWALYRTKPIEKIRRYFDKGLSEGAKAGATFEATVVPRKDPKKAAESA